MNSFSNCIVSRPLPSPRDRDRGCFLSSAIIMSSSSAVQAGAAALSAFGLPGLLLVCEAHQQQTDTRRQSACTHTFCLPRFFTDGVCSAALSPFSSCFSLSSSFPLIVSLSASCFSALSFMFCPNVQRSHHPSCGSVRTMARTVSNSCWHLLQGLFLSHGCRNALTLARHTESPSESLFRSQSRRNKRKAQQQAARPLAAAPAAAQVPIPASAAAQDEGTLTSIWLVYFAPFCFAAKADAGVDGKAETGPAVDERRAQKRVKKKAAATARIKDLLINIYRKFKSTYRQLSAEEVKQQVCSCFCRPSCSLYFVLSVLLSGQSQRCWFRRGVCRDERNCSLQRHARWCPELQSPRRQGQEASQSRWRV